jgi:hypothetical protein
MSKNFDVRGNEGVTNAAVNCSGGLNTSAVGARIPADEVTVKVPTSIGLTPSTIWATAIVPVALPSGNVAVKAQTGVSLLTGKIPPARTGPARSVVWPKLTVPTSVPFSTAAAVNPVVLNVSRPLNPPKSQLCSGSGPTVIELLAANTGAATDIANIKARANLRMDVLPSSI